MNEEIETDILDIDEINKEHEEFKKAQNATEEPPLKAGQRGKKKAPTKKIVGEAKPNIVWRGNREMRHDLYKCEIAKFLKNVSYKTGIVEPRYVEHTHYYHSIDSSGKKLNYTSGCGGHFHEVETGVDENGNLFAKCGPALQFVYKPDRRKGGTKKLVERVEWRDDDRDKVYTDNHTHVMTYDGSEILTQNGQKMIREKNREFVTAAVMANGVDNEG